MIESATVNKWKAEVAVKTRIQDILDILDTKFGPVAQDLRTKIESTKEQTVLQQWIVLATKTNTLEEFCRDAGL